MMTEAEDKVECAVVERKLKERFELVHYSTHKSVAWKSAASINHSEKYTAGHKKNSVEVVLRSDWDSNKVAFLPAPSDFDYTRITEESRQMQAEDDRMAAKRAELYYRKVTETPPMPQKKTVPVPVTVDPKIETVKKIANLQQRTQRVLDGLKKCGGDKQAVPAQAVADETQLPLHQVLAEMLVLNCKKLVTVYPEKKFSTTAVIPEMHTAPAPSSGGIDEMKL